MALLPLKEVHAFITGCEHLISASLLREELSKEEREIVEFYVLELQTLLKHNRPAAQKVRAVIEQRANQTTIE